jgi:hypothetical protein
MCTSIRKINVFVAGSKKSCTFAVHFEETIVIIKELAPCQKFVKLQERRPSPVTTFLTPTREPREPLNPT